MSKQKQMILGAAHHFLYPESMRDAQVHTRTLANMAEFEMIEALDCWVWPEQGRAKEEIRLLTQSGKVINYNIGDRFGEAPCLPCSRDPQQREAARQTMLREIDWALNCGARKIVFASGPDQPDCRADAVKRLMDFVLGLKAYLPDSVDLTLEPTDRDLDKHFLFGPLDETMDFILACREAGFSGLHVLLDMSHIPLMHTTIERAVKQCASALGHVHLGNCLISDPSHPFYGDKHVPWGYLGGVYDRQHVHEMMAKLDEIGYFTQDGRATVSFEMRPYEGLSPKESLCRFIEMLGD